MAGGLFGKPFVFNEKCIIFSIVCMILFLYKPTFTNPYFLYLSLFIIFIISYVSMAWYDYYFDCNLVPMERGKYSLTGKLKPPHKNTNNTDLSNSRKHLLVYIMHILLIVPLLLYISYYKQKSKSFVYTIIGIVAIFTAGYHGVEIIMFFK